MEDFDSDPATDLRKFRFSVLDLGRIRTGIPINKMIR